MVIFAPLGTVIVLILNAKFLATRSMVTTFPEGTVETGVVWEVVVPTGVEEHEINVPATRTRSNTRKQIPVFNFAFFTLLFSFIILMP